MSNCSPNFDQFFFYCFKQTNGHLFRLLINSYKNNDNIYIYHVAPLHIHKSKLDAKMQSTNFGCKFSCLNFPTKLSNIFLNFLLYGSEDNFKTQV
jgi:hypothetical protein